MKTRSLAEVLSQWERFIKEEKRLGRPPSAGTFGNGPIETFLLFAERAEQWRVAVLDLAQRVGRHAVYLLTVANADESIVSRLRDGPLQLLRDDLSREDVQAGVGGEGRPVVLLIEGIHLLPKGEQRDCARLIAEDGVPRFPRLLPEGSMVVVGALGRVRQVLHDEAMLDWEPAGQIKEGVGQRFGGRIYHAPQCGRE